MLDINTTDEYWFIDLNTHTIKPTKVEHAFLQADRTLVRIKLNTARYYYTFLVAENRNYIYSGDIWLICKPTIADAYKAIKEVTARNVHYILKQMKSLSRWGMGVKFEQMNRLFEDYHETIKKLKTI